MTADITHIHAAASTAPFSKWFDVHPALGISMMDHLFNRLDGAYPIRWRSAYSNQQAIDNWMESWAEAFEDERITPDEVKAGLRAIRKMYDWPPSIAEFIKACRPSIDASVAYHEAVAGVNARERGDMGKWTHPAIYWAASCMAFDLKNTGASAIKQRWETALQAEMSKGEWSAIPAPMIALPAPGKTLTDRQEATAALKRIGASGIVQNRVDHRNWIKEVFKRQEAGDETLPGISVRFAKEALAAREAK